MKRQLAIILHADVVGYSRLTGADEESTHEKLNSGLDLLSEKVAAHDGQKIHEAGDAILATFLSVTEAVNAAVGFQREMARTNSPLPLDERLEFRVGINLGEVIHDRGDVYGDGVNLAARIQEMAEPGGVCVSGAVCEQLRGRGEIEFDDLGHKSMKNISRPVRVYAIRMLEVRAPETRGVFFDNLSHKGPVATGGCLCGEVRFEITGKDVGSSYCHCRMCQRFAGAPVSAGTGFLSDDFRVTQGTPSIFQSSVIAERAFCPTCGSSLWIKHFGWQWIFVKTASLDNPWDFAPTTHFGVESQLPWHDVQDDLPRIRSQDSPELNELWEKAGVSVDDVPRSVVISKRTCKPGN